MTPIIVIAITGGTCSGKTTLELNLRDALCGTHLTRESNQYSSRYQVGFIGPTEGTRGQLLRWTGPETWIRLEMVRNRAKPDEPPLEPRIDLWPEFCSKLVFPTDMRYLVVVLGHKAYHEQLKDWLEHQPVIMREYLLYTRRTVELVERRMLMYRGTPRIADVPRNLRLPLPVFDEPAQVWNMEDHAALCHELLKEIMRDFVSHEYHDLEYYYNEGEVNEDLYSVALLQSRADQSSASGRVPLDEEGYTPFLCE